MMFTGHMAQGLGEIEEAQNFRYVKFLGPVKYTR